MKKGQIGVQELIFAGLFLVAGVGIFMFSSGMLGGLGEMGGGFWERLENVTEIEGVPEKQLVARNSINALVCAINSVMAESGEELECYEEFSKETETRDTTIKCTQFGGVTVRNLPAEKEKAVEMMGKILMDCFEFVETGDNVYCAKLNTENLNGQIEVSDVDSWLRANGGEIGKDILGIGTLDLENFEWTAGTISRGSPQTVAIFSDNRGKNELWVSDAYPKDPVNIPKNIWSMRAGTPRVNREYTDRETAIRELSTTLLKCFSEHIGQDFYCSEINTSGWADNVIITEDDVESWLENFGGDEGKDLVGEGYWDDNLEWSVDILKRNDPQLISVFADDDYVDEVHIYGTYKYEIPASEEPLKSCKVLNFAMPQEVSAKEEWIPYYGDPEYLAYWQVFPQDEDTWSFKTNWYVYAIIGVISVLPPVEVGKIFLGSAKGSLGRLFAKIGLKSGASAAKNIAVSAVTPSVISGAVKSGIMKAPVPLATASRKALVSQVSRHVGPALKEVTGEMAERLAAATAAEAPALARELAESATTRALAKGGVQSAVVEKAVRTQLVSTVGDRAAKEALKYAGLAGIKQQLKELVLRRIAGKEIPRTIKTFGILTVGAWTLALVDSMMQARFEPFYNSIVLKPALRSAEVFQLDRSWPVFVEMPHTEDYSGLLPELFSTIKTFHVASPCHLESMRVKKQVAECEDYIINTKDKTTTCSNRVSIETGLEPPCDIDSYMSLETENPYEKTVLGKRVIISEAVPHLRYIKEMDEIPTEFRFIYNGTHVIAPLYKTDVMYYMDPEERGFAHDRLVVKKADGTEVEIKIETTEQEFEEMSSAFDYYLWRGSNSTYGLEVLGYQLKAPDSYTLEMTDEQGHTTYITMRYDGFKWKEKTFGATNVYFTVSGCTADSEVCEKLKKVSDTALRLHAEKSKVKIGGEETEFYTPFVNTAGKGSGGRPSSALKMPEGINLVDQDDDGDMDAIKILSGSKTLSLYDSKDEGIIGAVGLHNCRVEGVIVQDMIKKEDVGANYCTRGKGTGTAILEYSGDVVLVAGIVISTVLTAGAASGAWVIAGGAWTVWAVTAGTGLFELGVEIWTEEFMGKWPTSW